MNIPTIPDIDPQEAAFLDLFFDPAAYLNRNGDVAGAGCDPVEHFLDFGHAEVRSTSPLFDPGMVNAARARDGLDPLPPLKRLDALEAEFDVHSVLGSGPLLCPAWLNEQLSKPAETLADLLNSAPPKHPISLHPMLRADTVTEATLAEALLALDDDAVEHLCLVDLDRLRNEHRDLRETESAHELLIFLLSRGIFENRLKYLGVGVPRVAPYDQLLAANIAAILRDVTGDALIEGQRMHQLPARQLCPVPGAAELVSTLRQNTGFDAALLPSVDQMLLLHRVVESGHAGGRLPGAPAVHIAPPLTDRDLLDGRARIETPRVVYSVNIGGYDTPPVPPVQDDCSYFFITDMEHVPAPWRIVRPTLRERDVKRQCLFYKTHPHSLFAQAEFTTWIDSNIECLSSAGSVLSTHENLSEIATFAHPDRSCIYTEAEEIERQALDHKDIVQAVVKRLKADGVPEKGGLYETNVLFSRAQDMLVREFMQTWWRLIALGSRRDQLSFTHAAHLTGLDISLLDGRDSAKTSRHFIKRPHVSRKNRFVA